MFWSYIDEKMNYPNPEFLQPDCDSCGLWESCQSPKMEVTGNGELGIFILAEAPGALEDRKGEQLVGKAGQRLRKELAQHGLDLDQHCWKMNAVNCRPPRNRNPGHKEINSCRPMVEREIFKLKPKVIIPLGRFANTTLFGQYYSNRKVNRWRGLKIPDHRFGAWICPTFHPSFLERNDTDKILQDVFRRDIIQALNAAEEPFPEPLDLDSNVFCLQSYKDVLDVLQPILEKKPVLYYDYETTGLKPYKPFHEVLSISLCTGLDDIGYSFPFGHKQSNFTEEETNHIGELWTKILLDPNIRLACHNMSMEYKWNKAIFGTPGTNWFFDTMLAAHIEDLRKKYIKLKFQSYIKFGVLPYDNAMKGYIESPSSHEKNKLEEVDLLTLLKYGGIDSFIGRKLMLKQIEFFKQDDNLRRALNFFLRGQETLCRITARGFHINREFYEKEEARIEIQLARIDRMLANLPEIKYFEKKNGRPFDPGSETDMQILLFKDLRIRPTKFTNGNKPSIDEEVLSKIDFPFGKKVVRRRKLLKIKNTYLAQYKREMFGDTINSNITLYFPRSTRSSSSDPNLQNIPTRNMEARRACRGGIVPPKGYRIMEKDYDSLEVKIMACVTEDPVLIEYCSDPNKDMHFDQAQEIFILPRNEMTKMIRFHAKNKAVFARVYGSYFKLIAPDLWEAMRDYPEDFILASGMPMEEHLRSLGLTTETRWMKHIEVQERQFWDKFRVTLKWRKWALNDYLKNNYVQMKTGFKRTGYLSRNKILNSHVQGPAFHCTLWSLNQLDRMMIEEWESFCFGQVHDSILDCVCPGEETKLIQLSNQVMCVDIKKVFPWIIVPLSVGYDIAPIDYSWADTISFDKFCLKCDTLKEKCGCS